MLKEEFLKLTGLEDISDAEYRGIEQVYEELPDIDKKDFCTMYRNEDFHQLMRWCKQLVCAKASMSAKLEGEINTLARLILLGDVGAARNEVHEILSLRECIMIKVRENVVLSADEIQYIEDYLF